MSEKQFASASLVAPKMSGGTAVDPARMGEVATTAVEDCYKAIESICASNEEVQAIAKQYSELSKALSDDFRKRAETLQSILENFVKHSSASAQRMTEEREHLKSLQPA